jgi:hypothetical protein
MTRQYRAGQSVEDHCRQCHEDRMHTVIVVDSAFQPLRVRCDYCGSEHNYRGGPRTVAGLRSPASGLRDDAEGQVSDLRPPVSRTAAAARAGSRVAQDSAPWPMVSERERRYSPTANQESGTRNQEPGTDMSAIDLETLLRRVIREETGLSPVAPAEKWRGGDLVLRPGKPGVQEKSWPIETFFHKVVMLRNRLRTLEQQVNASDLPDDQKVKIQSYITGCYGSLTSFNVLFADEEDKFVGAVQD